MCNSCVVLVICVSNFPFSIQCTMNLSHLLLYSPYNSFWKHFHTRMYRSMSLTKGKNAAEYSSIDCYIYLNYSNLFNQSKFQRHLDYFKSV